MRESFIFYASFYEALEGMDKESQADCLMALAKYALTGETKEIPMTPIVRMFFTLVKPQVDANNKRFENGCKGGRPKKNQDETEEKPNKNQTITKPKPNVNDNVNVIKENNNLAVITKESQQIDLEEWIKEKNQEPLPAKQKNFKKPTVDEVEAYVRESGYAVSAERFIAYYDSVGWKVGKNPMKDWKAALRGWAIREQARERTLRAASGLVGVRSETYGEGIPL